MRNEPRSAALAREAIVSRRIGALSAVLVLAAGGLVAAAGAGAAKPVVARATFAGGCFWCMEPPFEKIPGVAAVTSGYTGGQKVNPSYEEVSAGGTGHAESVEIVYDPAKVTYSQLLDVFWHNVDPLQGDGQFCDHGHQYRTAIFYHDAEQKKLAEESKEKVQARLGKPVVTEIVAASRFYPAEEYHQDFYKKSPVRYYTYRAGCGRDRRLKELWGAEAGSH
jgi:peptide-methionine (S)-S-oxide reductase